MKALAIVFVLASAACSDNDLPAQDAPAEAADAPSAAAHGDPTGGRTSAGPTGFPQSTCNTNRDCGAGQTCSFSSPYYFGGDGDGGGGGPSDPNEKGGFFHTEGYGYFCTTPNDKCIPGDPSAPPWACTYWGDHWDVGSAP